MFSSPFSILKGGQKFLLVTKFTPDQWQQISPYLDEALEMSAEERAPWLFSLREKDAHLASLLQGLLEEQQRLAEEGFLEKSLLPSSVGLAGQTIGAYTLVSQIGQGGMGSVWLARRSDGRFELEDRESHLASMCGVRIDMGPCAVVRAAGVTILLTSKKTPPFDLGQLRSQGIEPERLSVIGVKAAVAHRRAYDRIVKASFTVATPGPCSSDLLSFPYRHVRRPIDPLDDIASPAVR